MLSGILLLGYSLKYTTTKEDKMKFILLASIISLIALFLIPYNIYIGLCFAVIGSIMAFYSIKNNYLTYFHKKKYRNLLTSWLLMILLIAILFSFIQLISFNQSLGYLKFGECDKSTDFRTMAPSEIKDLPRFVPFDETKYLYYNVITLTTLGYGDICPQGDFFRWIAILEVLVGLAINLFFVAITLHSVTLSRKK